MNKNGRAENLPRRRGNAHRKQCIGVCVAILVIYVVYRTFMPGSDNVTQPYSDPQLTQNRFVQGEIRTEAYKIEQPSNQNIANTETEIANNLPADIGKDNLDTNGLMIDDGKEDVLDVYGDKLANEGQHLDQTVDELKELNTTVTESNKTVMPEPVKRFNPFVSETKSSTQVLNTTFSNGTTGVVARDAQDSEAYNKVKLVEDFTAQTKELADMVKNTLTKNMMNLTDMSSQNKTNAMDVNITNLFEKFSIKTENTLKLATDLLFGNNASLPNTNQNTNMLNKAEKEKLFFMESHDLIEIANEVFSKSASEMKNETKAMFLNKYAFNAQKLAKYSNSMLTSTVPKVEDTEQKLLNPQLPVATVGDTEQKLMNPQLPVEKVVDTEQKLMNPQLPVATVGDTEQKLMNPQLPVAQVGDTEQKLMNPQLPVAQVGDTEQKLMNPQLPVTQVGDTEQKLMNPQLPVENIGDTEQKLMNIQLPVENKLP